MGAKVTKENKPKTHHGGTETRRKHRETSCTAEARRRREEFELKKNLDEKKHDFEAQRY
jgi:hypothetical protein